MQEALLSIRAAISRGAPLYNSGDVRGCAQLYADTASALAATGALTEVSAIEVSSLVASPPSDPNTHAWALRHAFDRFLSDAEFVPRIEATLPAGFPRPRRVGYVEERTYPAYRAAVTAQGGAFGLLFRHISSNGIAMTAPVVSRMDDDGSRPVDMSFCYEVPSLGAPSGPRDGVSVVDFPPMRVLSVGVRGDGPAGEPALDLARRALDARLALGDVVSTGAWRKLGYNSPMVRPEQRYWELQVGIRDA
jgi:hypothetical protein